MKARRPKQLTVIKVPVNCDVCPPQPSPCSPPGGPSSTDMSSRNAPRQHCPGGMNVPTLKNIDAVVAAGLVNDTVNRGTFPQHATLTRDSRKLYTGGDRCLGSVGAVTEFAYMMGIDAATAIDIKRMEIAMELFLGFKLFQPGYDISTYKNGSLCSFLEKGNLPILG